MTLLSKIMAPRSAISLSRLCGSRWAPSTSAGDTEVARGGRHGIPSPEVYPRPRNTNHELQNPGRDGPLGPPEGIRVATSSSGFPSLSSVLTALVERTQTLSGRLDLAVQVDEDLVGAHLLDRLADLDGLRLDLEAAGP